MTSAEDLKTILVILGYLVIAYQFWWRSLTWGVLISLAYVVILYNIPYFTQATEGTLVFQVVITILFFIFKVCLFFTDKVDAVIEEVKSKRAIDEANNQPLMSDGMEGARRRYAYITARKKELEEAIARCEVSRREYMNKLIGKYEDKTRKEHYSYFCLDEMLKTYITAVLNSPAHKLLERFIKEYKRLPRHTIIPEKLYNGIVRTTEIVAEEESHLIEWLSKIVPSLDSGENLVIPKDDMMEKMLEREKRLRKHEESFAFIEDMFTEAIVDKHMKEGSRGSSTTSSLVSDADRILTPDDDEYDGDEYDLYGDKEWDEEEDPEEVDEYMKEMLEREKG